MEISQKLLGLMFTFAVIVGAGCGFFRDVIRFFGVLLFDEKYLSEKREGAWKKSIWHNIFEFFTDIIFCLLAAVAVVLLLYYTNDGAFRGLAILGVGGGFFVYRNTVSRLTDRLLLPLARLVRRILGFAGWLASRPAVFAVRLGKATIGRLALKMYESHITKKDERYSETKIRQYAEYAARGFGILDEDKEEKG